MGKYFRTIYLYIIVFATLCMVVTGFVGTVNSIVAYAYPVVDEYEVDTLRDYSELQEVAKRANLKSSFTYLAVLACGAPLYVFHVKQIKKESEKEV